ncbi:MAG TPA: coenzyme F420-0:L-glutamate ligase [Acidimicrobiales bacterium]|jgi:coenzyme F420-0:L-glutamate ligase/coenzyme F420-1:gamma-L-glutamate ligase
MELQITAVEGFPLVEAGDDLAALILDALRRAAMELRSGDVVVVTGKVVSKAEGRLVDLATIEPSARAERLGLETEKDPRLVELVLRESVDVIRARPGNLLVRHQLGYVSAMAGIDRSNVEGGDDVALLLPVDPDASASAIRASLHAVTGVWVAVVVTDSHGRPFRVGNTGVALGVAGLPAVRELEGRPDLYGRPLTAASVVPVADLVASTAMLISGEADEGRPVVVIRGLELGEEDPSPGTMLLRPRDKDLFAVPDKEY